MPQTCVAHQREGILGRSHDGIHYFLTEGACGSAFRIRVCVGRFRGVLVHVVQRSDAHEVKLGISIAIFVFGRDIFDSVLVYIFSPGVAASYLIVVRCYQLRC